MDRNECIFAGLVGQLKRLAKHNRQGSFQTRKRYYEAMLRFCRYLADEFGLQKLENLSGKHLAAYVEYLQDTDMSASTVKTDLSAIRFWHDKLSNAKHSLPSNDELSVELERRCFGELDRTWSDGELSRMIGQVEADGHFEYACAMRLGRFCGLRIHEVFRLDTATAERALRENALTVKGKGGKLRRVPIEHASVRSDLSAMLSRTRRGHKLFVPDGVPTDRAINRLQAYLIKHRDALADADRDTNLTFHGLRHSYAAEKYKELTDNGMSALDARFVVSRLLGHERADVTDNYLSSVRRKGVRKNEGA